ncbi:MAG: helix-turn-helix domain-containing protein [Bacilli bacterium]|nr:helix-turn-helix domain-containing protein [Bacilli bacterium]
MTVKKQLGMRVRYLRQRKGMSIEDLALECNINRNYLSDLERGTRNPSIDIISRISVGLNVSLEELFKGIQVIY